MTYNIRYATERDEENQWENRKSHLTEQISFHAPDVFGVQEALLLQLNFIDSVLVNYSYLGVGRDDGKKQGEYCAIFYDKRKIQLVSHDTFWLSKTPETPSKDWDAAYKRICTYAYFRDKLSGKKFWVFNTHFDHIGEIAREKSAELIVAKTRELTSDGEAVFVMGDFNLNEKSKAIGFLSGQFDDARMASETIPFGPFGTFTGFEYNEPVKDRIDYIFCSKNMVKVKKYGVLTDSKSQRFPSDHFPVMIKAEILEVKN